MSEQNWEEEEGYERFIADIYEELKPEAIEEFTDERLQAYYIDNKLLAKPAIDALSEAQNLAASHATGRFIFASIAMEVGLKTTLLKPIVYGLVNTESAADFIANLTIRHRIGSGDFEKLLFHVLQEHGGVDFKNFKRSDSNTTLWKEIMYLQNVRDKIMHRAEVASQDNVDLVLGVASEILEVIFPAVINKIGLHLHDSYRICDDSMCKYKDTMGV